MTNETGAVKIPADTPLDDRLRDRLRGADRRRRGAQHGEGRARSDGPGARRSEASACRCVQGGRATGAAHIIGTDPTARGAKLRSDGRDQRDRPDRRRRRGRHHGDHRSRRRLHVRVRRRRRRSPRWASRRPAPAAPPSSSARPGSTGTRDRPLVLFGVAEKKLMGCFLGRATRSATSPASSPCGGPASSTSRPSSPPPTARRDQRGLHRPGRRCRHPHRDRPGLSRSAGPTAGGLHRARAYTRRQEQGSHEQALGVGCKSRPAVVRTRCSS